jgi:endonuclease III
MEQRDLAALTVKHLKEKYPDAECTLDYEQPWHLLVAAILSAQCTDARVNLITPAVFSRYPDLAALAGAELSELEDLIRSCGLYRTKARNILASAQMLLRDFHGELPQSSHDLVKLPGVGRKIANLILGDCFGLPAIVVDTHCARISKLIGLTASKDPLTVERDLVQVLPEQDWIAYGHLMVTHGREICIARRPDCLNCPLKDICHSSLAQ